jgi:hypothetical protein
MTKDEIIEQLKVLQRSGDPEIAHDNADFLLCEFLEQLGYEDVVKEYCEIEKWYA